MRGGGVLKLPACASRRRAARAAAGCAPRQSAPRGVLARREGMGLTAGLTRQHLLGLGTSARFIKFETRLAQEDVRREGHREARVDFGSSVSAIHSSGASSSRSALSAVIQPAGFRRHVSSGGLSGGGSCTHGSAGNIRRHHMFQDTRIAPRKTKELAQDDPRCSGRFRKQACSVQ